MSLRSRVWTGLLLINCLLWAAAVISGIYLARRGQLSDLLRPYLTDPGAADHGSQASGKARPLRPRPSPGINRALVGSRH